jgi:PPOX class probable F420-dependent enzyme
MLGLDPELAACVNERLEKETIIWFTTINPKGIPVPNPVWFHWDGECITVYSEPSSLRLRNIQQNPNVALTLQGVDALGNNVVIINGKAEVRTGNRSIPEEYWKKYSQFLDELKMTIEGIVCDYSVEIRIKPTRIRAA